MRRGARVDVGLSAIAVAVSVATAIAIVKTAGEFAYTLDDPYIHLRLSEMIASGTYGINPGEPASPSSSILWPFLLAPFAAAPFHHLVPLALNTVALALTLVLARRTLAQTWTGARQWMLGVLAVVIGIPLGWFTLPFTGMEHSLQILTAALCAAGLVATLTDGRPPWWFWTGVTVAPVIRYDSLAFAVPTLLAVAALGRWKGALASAATAGAVLTVFSAYLLSQGLPVLPSSVLAKADGSLGGVPSAAWTIGSGQILALAIAGCFAVLILLLLRTARLGDDAPARGWFVVVAAGLVAVSLQLFVGTAHWQLGRYQAAVLTFSVFTALLALPVALPRIALGAGPLAAALAVPLLVAVVSPRPLIEATITVEAARGIHDQQAQVHRFVTDHLRTPVAVNDLGLVSFRNPQPVLDLIGLGSERARLARTSGDANWMSRVVDPSTVPAAALYEAWFGSAIPATWVRVGTITADGVTTALPDVAVYATDASHAPRVAGALADFAEDVGPRTTITLTP